MNDIIAHAVQILKESEYAIALTGAGISVDSGIPDFRGERGLWRKYDPEHYATLEAFRTRPEQVWEMFFEVGAIVYDATPNPAHTALAELERIDVIKSIITQNIDGLHDKAGSRKVIPLHGTIDMLECIGCYNTFDSDLFNVREGDIPRCPDCDTILKPTIILFGEEVNQQYLDMVWAEIKHADVLLVVGTSATVYPAAVIPEMCKENNAIIIESNIAETELTAELTDVFLSGNAANSMQNIVKQLKG